MHGNEYQLHIKVITTYCQCLKIRYSYPELQFYLNTNKLDPDQFNKETQMIEFR